MKYTYRWGQRPLDGFTIKRGVGQGGFGEVYYAMSDGGKEVALKLIRGQTDIRGSLTCLNLKHPNLVHLYDMRRDPQGDCWLVMEYIQGETLDRMIKSFPNGVGEERAKRWFLELGRAVHYLHDHAVIHRDIKPLNLFVEQGILKLGDYGLSKASTSTQIAHTSNAGSILYMAPEISSGNYSKQIDIYACGVVLYEMLTGSVPFRGESWAEIAIRHQMDDPDLSIVPAAYRGTLRRALHKNTGLRYSSMQEMIDDVERISGSEEPPVLLPRLLSQPPASVLTPASHITSPNRVRLPVMSEPTFPASRPVPRIPSWQGKFRELAPALATAPLIGVPGMLLWGACNRAFDWSTLAPIFLLTIVTTWLILIPAKFWDGTGSGPSRRRMAFLGALLGTGVFWLDGWSLESLWSMISADATTSGGRIDSGPETVQAFVGYLVFFSFFMSAIRWHQNADRKREEPFTFFPVLVAAFWSGVFLLIGHWTPMPGPYVVLALASAAGSIQIVSPWVPPPPPAPRKLRFTPPNAA